MLARRAPIGRLATAEVVGANPQVSGARTAGEAPSATLVHIVWRRRWIVLGCIIVSIASSMLYLSKAIPLYSSTSQIYIQQVMPRILDGVASNNAANLLTQCELIRSTAILSSALESPTLVGLKSLAGSSNPLGVLRQAIDAQAAGKTDILTVSAISTVPEDAAVMTNAVVEAYIDYQAKRTRSSAAEVLKILQKEKEKDDQALSLLSKRMLQYKRDNGTLSFDSEKGGNIVTQRLAQLADAVTMAQIDTLNKKVAVEAVEAMGDDAAKLRQLIATQGVSGGGSNPFADNADLANQLRQAQRRAAALHARYGEGNPTVAAADNEVFSMEGELAYSQKNAVVNYRAALKQRLLEAQQKETELRKAFEAQKSEALSLNTQAAEYGQLQTDARRLERLLDSIDSRIKEINVTEETGTLNISVMEPARPDLNPFSPNRSRTLAMALMMGLMTGIGGALLQDYIDQRLRSAEEIAAVLQVPVLGVIAHVIGKQTASERGREVALKPKSEQAEAYRTIRTAVYFGSSENSKTLLVTSPMPGDGKTTVSSNLAVAMAQASRRVLLIDADCRRPMQHKIFGVKSDVGLSTILMGQATSAQAIQHTGIENLDIIPCGPLPPNPAELLNSQAFSDLIALLSVRYDQIVIDSPPVVPVTDSRILAASCDAVLLVFRAEKTTRRLGLHARDALLSVGANLIGAVVNDVPRNQNGYGYYYSGYYRYGYGASTDGKNSSNGSNGNGANGNGANGKGHRTDGIVVKSVKSTEV